MSAETKADRLYDYIGRAVQARRVELGLTQAQLAKRLGISRPSLANIEAGRQRVLVHHIYEFADALMCSTASLVPKQKVTRDWVFLIAGSTARPAGYA